MIIEIFTYVKNYINDNAQKADVWVAIGGWLVATLTLTLSFITFLFTKSRDNRVELQENYLRLELESNEVFRFEAQHVDILEVYKASDKPTDYGKQLSDEERNRRESIADNFYLQQLNLFEIAARFRRKNVFNPHIFGSWVIWYHDVTRSWWFIPNSIIIDTFV